MLGGRRGLGRGHYSLKYKDRGRYFIDIIEEVMMFKKGFNFYSFL